MESVEIEKQFHISEWSMVWDGANLGRTTVYGQIVAVALPDVETGKFQANDHYAGDEAEKTTSNNSSTKMWSAWLKVGNV